jgi:tRNA nucleotidyltransferase (CCA-adding enzyme)
MGIRGFGRTREEAFGQTALALTAIVADPSKIEQRTCIEIVCEEDDDEMLLWYWLNAVLYEMATRNMLFARFEVAAVDAGIRATAWGEVVDIARHEPAVEVKAATYADLKVECDSRGRWVAQCVVDV